MKTFLSIGAGPGMGLETAERFAREGFQVVLSARNAGKAQELADQLKAKGYKAEARTVDTSDRRASRPHRGRGAGGRRHRGAALQRRRHAAGDPGGSAA